MNKVEWKAKKTNLGNIIIAASITLVLGLIIGLNWDNWFASFAPYLGGTTSSMDWSSLDEVYNKLASSYNGEIDKTAIIEGAKKGLVESLNDDYTAYMDKITASDFNDSLHGNVGSGVGIEMGLRDGYVRVLRTLPDNPAKKAGILAGDIIYKVNDEDVYALSADDIATRIRGETGSEVTVTVVRDGEELSFKMIRETINNVSAFVNYDDKTAIVTIRRFDTDTGTLVQSFAKDFANKEINKVILDLRDNGGGYVSAAQDLLSLWLNGDKIFVQKSLHFGNTTTSAYTGKAILANMKTIVLVNGSTASASEITAGALQDYKKATIVGETTYGKGVVQNLYDLSGGTMLKVTTADWYTPLNRSINKTGISPDVAVERTYEDINTMKDPQLDKAKEL